MKAAARPYAEALFEIASSEAAVAGVLSELEAIDRALTEVPRARVLLVHPGLAPEAAEQLLERVVADRAPMVSRFIRLLADKGRIGILPDVVRALRDRQDQAEGRVRARVQTARPMAAEDVRAVEGALERRLGHRVQVSCEVRDDVIGGARVVVGDRVLDGSVAGHLAALRRRLLAARN